MNIAQTLFNSLAVVISLMTASSLFVHDTNLDKAFVKAFAAQADHISAPSSSPHTHQDGASLSQAMRDLNATQPRAHPRGNKDRRYVMGKPNSRGHHPFDNPSLPLNQLVY